MSLEDDTELRDLVMQTIETNGCLGKIRAQLRASIFLALDEDDNVNKAEPMLNKKIKTHTESSEGKAMFCIVREFLEFFDLDFTISVYEPESYLGMSYKYNGRCGIIQELGISELEESSPFPLLLQLIRLARLNNKVSSNTEDVNVNHTNSGSTNESLNHSNEGTNTEREEQNDHDRTIPTITDNIEEAKNSTSEELQIVSKPKALDATFNLSAPSIDISPRSDIGARFLLLKKSEMQLPNININGYGENEASPHISQNAQDTARSTSDIEKDDTYEQTSSIAEDSVQKDAPLIDLDKSVKIPEIKVLPTDSEKQKGLLDQSLNEVELTPPILKESKSHSKLDTSVEKLKLSPQITEKLKPKNSLSSLADLPPLQISKSRSNESMILPSLYNKEFKEKACLKEIDKLLDMDLDSMDNYEEDFMSGSELELSISKPDRLKADSSKIDLSATGSSEKSLEIVVKNLTNKEKNDSFASSIVSENIQDNELSDDNLTSAIDNCNAH